MSKYLFRILVDIISWILVVFQILSAMIIVKMVLVWLIKQDTAVSVHQEQVLIMIWIVLVNKLLKQAFRKKPSLNLACANGLAGPNCGLICNCEFGLCNTNATSDSNKCTCAPGYTGIQCNQNINYCDRSKWNISLN
jgi:hypothetical protein